MPQHPKGKKREERKPSFGINVDFGMGNFLTGLGNLVGQLSELAEKAEEISKTGEVRMGKELKGMYGFNIKVGGLGKEREVHIEPFGNIRRDKEGTAVVDEVREPLVDIFDEEDHVLVVAEMPGVEEKDINLRLHGDILQISTKEGKKKYQKEVLLPGTFLEESMSHTCKNGMLEVRLIRNK